jgi:hypothetical protein
MTPITIARDMPMDDLVVRVYHLELAECRTWEEFKESARLIVHNVDAVLEALGCDLSVNRRVCRSVDLVKTKAIRMKGMCAALPESFDDPEGWRGVSSHIIVNYEQFRIEAGMLYQQVVPGSRFGVLRAAL